MSTNESSGLRNDVNQVMESRVKTFINSVQKNVRNELSDIFDEDEGRTESDVVMNINEKRSHRKDRNCKTKRKSGKGTRRRKRENASDSEKNADLDGSGNDSKARAEKCVETIDVTDGDQDADQESKSTSDISEILFEEIKSMVEAMIESMTQNMEQNASDASEDDNNNASDENAQIDSIESTENTEKNEINIHSVDTPNGEEQTSEIKDLNTEGIDILNVIMSADEEKGQLLARLKELYKINEDLKTITSLGPQDKLWIETKAESEKLKLNAGDDSSKTYEALSLHQANVWLVDATVRTYYGQGRGNIIAHISKLVDAIEAQTEYTDVLTRRDYIPSYINMIRDAASKIETNMMQQYENMQDEIETLVSKMRDAATTMEGVHNAGRV